MFLLRRTAARAIASTPSTAFFVKPRSIATITPVAFRPASQQWIIPSFQKRFASDEPAKAETSENFAQTATEAPVEQNLSPADETTQAPQEPVAQDIAQEQRSQQRGHSTIARNISPSNVLYVGNLYYEVTATQLERVFSRFGEIESTKIIYDNRGLSRGFGYITYKNVNDATAAVDNLDMQVFEGRNLVVQFTRPKQNAVRRARDGSIEPNLPSKTLFIGNMSYEMSDKDLNDLFRDIRNVLDVRVAIDRRTGQPRGFAHADFIDVASATRAMEILKDKTIYGRTLRVDYGKSGADRRREQANGAANTTDTV